MGIILQKSCPGESYFMAKHLAATLRSRTAWRRLAVALLCAWVALAPSLAEARAGSSSGAGSSMGSRGSRTYDNNGGAPMQRSVTPTPAPSQPQFAPRPGPLAPAYGGGFMQQHPFMSGLMGGFIGAGLAGMLFGHSAYAADGGGGFGSMLGLLLQFAVIGGLISLGVSFFCRPRGLPPAPPPFPRPVPPPAPPPPRPVLGPPPPPLPPTALP